MSDLTRACCKCPLPYRAMTPETHEESCPALDVAATIARLEAERADTIAERECYRQRATSFTDVKLLFPHIPSGDGEREAVLAAIKSLKADIAITRSNLHTNIELAFDFKLKSQRLEAERDEAERQRKTWVALHSTLEAENARLLGLLREAISELEYGGDVIGAARMKAALAEAQPARPPLIIRCDFCMREIGNGEAENARYRELLRKSLVLLDGYQPFTADSFRAAIRSALAEAQPASTEGEQPTNSADMHELHDVWKP